MKYYLINNKVMKAFSELPKETIMCCEDFEVWQSSLEICEISDSELDKILVNLFGLVKEHLFELTEYEQKIISVPIEVTNIVEEREMWCMDKASKVNCIFFKQKYESECVCTTKCLKIENAKCKDKPIFKNLVSETSDWVERTKEKHNNLSVKDKLMIVSRSEELTSAVKMLVSVFEDCELKNFIDYDYEFVDSKYKLTFRKIDEDASEKHNEAIEFAEWIAKEGIKPSCSEGMWLIIENYDDIKHRLTSKELYEMFKSIK